MNRFSISTIAAGALLVGSLQASDLSLKKGWNLVGFCSDVSSSSFNNGELSEIQASDGKFYNFTEQKGSLTSFDSGYGYWIESNNDTTITLEKSRETVISELSSGWKLVGICDNFSLDEFTTLSANTSEIQSDKGLFYNFNEDKGNLSDLEEGQGYWVKVNPNIDSLSIVVSKDDDQDGIINDYDLCPTTVASDISFTDDNKVKKYIRNTETEECKILSFSDSRTPVLEVDVNGIPAIPVAQDTTAEIGEDGESVIINFTEEVMLAQTGATPSKTSTKLDEIDANSVSIPITTGKQYVKIIGINGTSTIFELKTSSKSCVGTTPPVTEVENSEVTTETDLIVDENSENTDAVEDSNKTEETTNNTDTGISLPIINNTTDITTTPEEVVEENDTNSEIVDEEVVKETATTMNVTLLEVDINGIPSIPVADATTAEVNQDIVTITFIEDVLLAQYGSIPNITDTNIDDKSGATLNIPLSTDAEQYVKVIGVNGTTTIFKIYLNSETEENSPEETIEIPPELPEETENTVGSIIEANFNLFDGMTLYQAGYVNDNGCANYELTPPDDDNDGVANDIDECPSTDYSLIEAGGSKTFRAIMTREAEVCATSLTLSPTALLEVDTNGIPSIPVAEGTSVEVNEAGDSIVVTFIEDVLLAQYGNSAGATSTMLTPEGATVTLTPNTGNSNFVKVIGTGGTTTIFQIDVGETSCEASTTEEVSIDTETEVIKDTITTETEEIITDDTSNIETTVEEDVTTTEECSSSTTVTLLEVDTNGIPSIPVAQDTIAEVTSDKLMITFVEDVLLAQVGDAPGSTSTMINDKDGTTLALDIPENKIFVKIIGNAGTTTIFSVNPSVSTTSDCSNSNLEENDDNITEPDDVTVEVPDEVEEPVIITGSLLDRKLVNSVGCALYQLDEDSDGVSNTMDMCSNTITGTTVNKYGCDVNCISEDCYLAPVEDINLINDLAGNSENLNVDGEPPVAKDSTFFR